MLNPRVIRDLYLSADVSLVKLIEAENSLRCRKNRSPGVRLLLCFHGWLKSLNKVMEGAKAMTAQMVQISENNLDAEGLKLRAKEVKSLDENQGQN